MQDRPRNYRVRLDNAAQEAMALAAIEAYCLGDGGRRTRHQIETLGYCWGHYKVEPQATIIHISLAAVSISASRTSSSVAPHPEAAGLKRNFIEHWAPQMTLIGDFHSHPYESLDVVRSNNGFEFSDLDFESFLADDRLWEDSDNLPVMFAITICKLQRVRLSTYEQLRSNVARFSVGEFSFWFIAAVGYLDTDGRRNHTGNTHSPVYLDMGSRFLNIEGHRIRE